MNIDYEQLARRIREIATAAVSEMDLQVKVEKILDPYIPRVPGVESSHYGHSATNFRGIKDAFHGSLIIEYERPGKLSTAAGKSEAIEQLTRYLTQEARPHGPHAQDALRRMAGVGLDGESILFVRWRGSKPGTPPPKFADLLPGAQSALFPDAMPTEYFHLLGPYPVNAETVRALIDVYLRNLSRIPLDPERLAEAFGPKSPVAQSVVGAMYERLASSNAPRVLTFFGEWERIFGIVYGQDIEKSEVDAAALGDQFGIPEEPQLKRLLFVIHTYFALLMKLLAAEILSLQQGAMAPSFIEPMVTYESDNFRAALSDIEDGALFSRLGIRNFLEGDFFSWYLGVIDVPLLEALRDMVRTLAHFEPRTPSLDPTSSRDLLKRLYQYLVPKKLRHDLGEYYTPDWLADLVLNQMGYGGEIDKKLLDPACGSGTFLVLAIRRIRDYADENLITDGKRIAEAILSNLCGFDLNPIAVIAARTNFLLNLGELRRHVGTLELPIYMCDSVLTPSQHRAQQNTTAPAYDVPTRAGTFSIPREYVDGGNVERLAILLEEAVRDTIASDLFLRRVDRELHIEQPETRELLKHLHEQLMSLENDDRNRVWARYIKNSFAPVFKAQAPFDFIAGNPPWVNWESLAEEYRNATKQLWADYGFFTQRGYRAVVAGGPGDHHRGPHPSFFCLGGDFPRSFLYHMQA